MSEIAPVTEPVATPAPTPEAKPTSKGSSADRRAAAFAALPEDMAAADRADAKAPPDDAAESVVAAPVEPAKAEEPPKPVEPPDALAARAAADRFLMRERESIKAEREALAKERAEWEAKAKSQPDTSHELESYRRLVSTDLVSVADKEGWTPQQRFEMAKALSWSAHPEDKRPPGWRGNGQGQVMSEVEQVKAELAKTKAEVDNWKKEQAEQAQKAQEAQQMHHLGDQIMKAIPSDALYAKGKAEHNPDEARSHLAQIAKNMIAAERKAAQEEWRDPKQITEADVVREYDKWLKSRYEAEFGFVAKVAPPTPASAKSAAKVPPAAATASPSPVRSAKQSAEERRRAALEALPEKLD